MQKGRGRDIGSSRGRSLGHQKADCSLRSNHNQKLSTPKSLEPKVRIDTMIKFNRQVPIDRIKLLIFDLDGTLVDSRIDLVNSVNAMLKNFHRPELPSDVIATYVGDGAPMLVRRALGDPQDEGYVKEALEFFLTYYRAHKLDNT